MGRKNKHSAEEFKELVLTTMESHLDEAPANELSLRKLAAKIDYAPGMLLSVFKSFNNLLLQVNARTLDSMRAYVEAECPQRNEECPQRNGISILQHYGQRYLQFAVNNPHRWQLVFDHKMPAQEEVPAWMQAKIDAMFQLIASEIAMLVEIQKLDKTYYDAQRIETSAKTLWASVHGITQLALQGKLFTQADIQGNRLIDNLMNNYFDTWLEANPSQQQN